MSAAEQKYHDDEHSFEELMNLIPRLRVPEVKSKEQAWKDIEADIAKKQVVLKRSLNIWGNAIAASVALLVGFSMWFYAASDTKIWCGPAQMATVYLPDSSEVTLNAASSLVYNKMSWKKLRVVKLEGEAFFRVKKGSRFDVVTFAGKVSVLGTSFNVFARDNFLKVYCETGKVAVISTDTVVLKPGMKAKLTTGAKAQIIVENHITEGSWQKGDFWFSNSPLPEVIVEIERQFDVDVEYEGLGNRYYSGYFNKSSLSEALKAVFYPMRLKYRIENKRIIIYK